MIIKESVVSNTTPDNYITAITALNIPSDEGTGDWHFFENFIPYNGIAPTQHIAEINTLSTKKWFGGEGIYDCYEILIECGLKESKKKIYAADHYRAIADMVYNNVKRGENIKDTISLNDWLPELHEKKRIYGLVDRFRHDLTTKEWEKIEQWKELTRASD